MRSGDPQSHQGGSYPVSHQHGTDHGALPTPYQNLIAATAGQPTSHNQHSATPALSTQPTINLPTERKVLDDNELMEFISKRLIYYRNLASQVKQSNGRPDSNEGQALHFASKEHSTHGLQKQSDCSSIMPKAGHVASRHENFSFTVGGEACEDGHSKKNEENAELTRKANNDDCAGSTAERRSSTGTPVCSVENAKAAHNNESVEKSAPVDFDLPLKTGLYEDGDGKLIYSNDNSEEKAFFSSKWCEKTIKNASPTVPVLHYSLVALKELVASLENVETITETDNISDIIVQRYWNGNNDNVSLFTSTEYPHIMLDVAATCAKNEDESPVVLSTVPGMPLSKLIEKHPTTEPVNCHSLHEYASGWLNINKNLDNMEQEDDARSLKPVEVVQLENMQDVPSSDVECRAKPSSVLSEKKALPFPPVDEKQEPGKQKTTTDPRHEKVHKLSSPVSEKEIHNSVSLSANQGLGQLMQINHEDTQFEEVPKDKTELNIELSENKCDGTASHSRNDGEGSAFLQKIKNPQYEDITDAEDDYVTDDKNRPIENVAMHLQLTTQVSTNNEGSRFQSSPDDRFIPQNTTAGEKAQQNLCPSDWRVSPLNRLKKLVGSNAPIKKRKKNDQKQTPQSLRDTNVALSNDKADSSSRGLETKNTSENEVQAPVKSCTLVSRLPECNEIKKEVISDEQIPEKNESTQRCPCTFVEKNGVFVEQVCSLCDDRADVISVSDENEDSTADDFLCDKTEVETDEENLFIKTEDDSEDDDWEAVIPVTVTANKFVSELPEPVATSAPLESFETLESFEQAKKTKGNEVLSWHFINLGYWSTESEADHSPSKDDALNKTSDTATPPEIKSETRIPGSKRQSSSCETEDSDDYSMSSSEHGPNHLTVSRHCFPLSPKPNGSQRSAAHSSESGSTLETSDSSEADSEPFGQNGKKKPKRTRPLSSEREDSPDKRFIPQKRHSPKPVDNHSTTDGGNLQQNTLSSEDSEVSQHPYAKEMRVLSSAKRRRISSSEPESSTLAPSRGLGRLFMQPASGFTDCLQLSEESTVQKRKHEESPVHKKRRHEESLVHKKRRHEESPVHKKRKHERQASKSFLKNSEKNDGSIKDKRVTSTKNTSVQALLKSGPSTSRGGLASSASAREPLYGPKEDLASSNKSLSKSKPFPSILRQCSNDGLSSASMQQHLSSSTGHRSTSIDSPSTHTVQQSNSNEGLSGNAQDKVREGWASMYHPTRKDKRCPPVTSPTHSKSTPGGKRYDARPGPSHCGRPPKQKHNDPNLMKKSKDLAKRLTNESRPVQKKYRSEQGRTHVGEGYKWAEGNPTNNTNGSSRRRNTSSPSVLPDEDPYPHVKPFDPSYP